ncbi:uncharacterized protein LOC127841769 [Dreissena polymorpha]|uniref:C1q domain-containing protein n=1 Tax=Dreissena polymorpha TaxID=45954 RepID=A0A9D4IUK5_DREPO|nr:uncharacterized protein LOC127841769 [Dreissena polymorpha]KAH3784653.1 hypothetical protein DPMN_162616 [Dreissena polymorpha]
MIPLFYAFGMVILLTLRAQCELSSDTAFRLLSARLDDIVFDMKWKEKSVTKQIEDLLVTVATTNQRLDSVEKRLSDVSAKRQDGGLNKQHGEELVSIERRLNDLASCSQTMVSFEKRLGDLENIATVEVGRRMQLLRRGFEQEKTATQLRFDSFWTTQERLQSEIDVLETSIKTQLNDTHVQLSKVEQNVAIALQNSSTFLARIEHLQNTHGNLKSNIEDIKLTVDTQINDTQVQLSNVKLQIAHIVHNTSKGSVNLEKTNKDPPSETEVAINNSNMSKFIEEVTTTMQDTRKLVSRMDAVERTQGGIESKTNGIGRLVHETRDQISQLQRITGTFFGFSVELGSGSTYGKSSIIKFDLVYYNVGYHYNPSTGIFTVPVSGVYVFMFNVEASSALFDVTRLAHVALFVDWNTKTEAVAQGVYPNLTGGNAAVLDVEAGDEVFIATRNTINQHYIAGSRTSFSGALLHVHNTVN